MARAAFARAWEHRPRPGRLSSSAGEVIVLGTAAAEAISALLLAAVLAGAVIRPWGWPEAAVAVPAAVAVIAIGAISPHRAWAEALRLGPVIGFLAAVLVLAQLGQDEGLFRACGAWLARGRAEDPRRLLARVFVIAWVVTAVLSLDATVVLLTPWCSRRCPAGRPGPAARVGCTHLANSASLLLPVSNLTNLLAFAVQRPGVHPVRGDHGAAAAGRHRRGICGLPAVLPK